MDWTRLWEAREARVALQRCSLFASASFCFKQTFAQYLSLHSLFLFRLGLFSPVSPQAAPLRLTLCSPFEFFGMKQSEIAGFKFLLTTQGEKKHLEIAGSEPGSSCSNSECSITWELLHRLCYSWYITWRTIMLTCTVDFQVWKLRKLFATDCACLSLLLP